MMSEYAMERYGKKIGDRDTDRYDTKRAHHPLCSMSERKIRSIQSDRFWLRRTDPTGCWLGNSRSPPSNRSLWSHLVQSLRSLDFPFNPLSCLRRFTFPRWKFSFSWKTFLLCRKRWNFRNFWRLQHLIFCSDYRYDLRWVWWCNRKWLSRVIIVKWKYVKNVTCERATARHWGKIPMPI